jgi:DNA mismatch repair protein MutS2
MRDRDLQTLEFDKVLVLLAEGALSSAGREACLAVRPQREAERVTAESERTWQFFQLLHEHPSLPHRPFPDIRALLQRAAPAGAMLEGQALLDILAVVTQSRTLAAAFLRWAGSYDQLADLPARLLAFPALEETLRRCLTENGDLTDDASPALRALRQRRRALGEEIERRLQHLLRAPEMDDIFADRYITTRNHRCVLPVRASRQARLPGVVQDRSSSGETVFLEPLTVVDLNNRLLLTQKEEEAEERRVLVWLTSLVRDEVPRLVSVFATLTTIDVLYAKVLLARRQHCSKPCFGGNEIRLRSARHPLLLATGKAVTPIDLFIPEGKSGLIISGPNTGGKTVALKTIGLLCLMAQSGLLIPAEADNRLPIFRGIFADIGDPQSLEQSLSTFAAHMHNLADLLRDVSPPALVLFDEPGGGTDPTEGGALACGVLTYLKTCGVMVVAATHLAPVKLFALAEGSYEVAAVAFDLDTLTPHYRLHYDTIGQSLGLSMARRLGVPEAVCAAAEAALSHESRVLVQAIAKLDAAHATVERERAQAAAEHEHATTLRVRYQTLVADLERKQRLLQEQLTTARTLVHQLRRAGREHPADWHDHLDATVAAWVDAETPRPQPVPQRGNIIAADQPTSHPLAPVPSAQPQVGDKVETQDGRIQGELVAVQGERARIRHGSVTFDVAVAQVRKSP